MVRQVDYIDTVETMYQQKAVDFDDLVAKLRTFYV